LIEERMNDHRMGRAPDYKNACIVMFGVNITWVLVAIWAIWGLIAAALLGLGVNHLMTRIEAWAAERQAASIRRGKQV
jgi:F0F1-type ATP synthase assembly protein I